MNVRREKLTWYVAGVFSGVLAILVLFCYLLLHTADWLVIENEPYRTDAVIVLGGGGGSRLLSALDLYEQGFVSELVLVGFKAKSWEHITANLCPDCDLTGKNVTLINGSSTTITDAHFSLQFCKKRKIKAISVVTDPYHTRRASITFGQVFRDSDIIVHIMSSGDFGGCLSPDKNWWQHKKTLETVWEELGKSLHMVLFDFLPGRYFS